MAVSWDYSVVVRARKRKPDKIRELAVRLAKSYEGELVAPENAEFDEEDDDDDELELHFAFKQGGGTIEVTRLKRGYRLYLDSQRDGNRDSWDDIAGLANDLAAKLGTVVDDDELAAQMIEESEALEEVDADEPTAQGPPDVAIVRIEARDGTLIQELAVAAGVMLRAVDGGGMLRDDSLADYPVLTEEGRYHAKAGRVVATLHGRSGEAYRRHRWSCDGYGRILSAEVEEL